MGKALKVVALALGGILFVLIAGAVAVSLLFDPNDYKEELTAWVKSHTGRTVTIEDDLGLTYFPWLGVETGNVTVSDAPGFGTEPFATIEHVNASVRVGPLLRRQIEVGTVAIDGLRLNLARNKDGVSNWDDLAAAARATDTTAAPAPAPAAASVAVAGLELREATISWHDQAADQRYLFEHVALETGALKPDEPVDLTLTLSVAQPGGAYSGDLDLRGTLRADLAQSRYEIERLTLGYTLRDAKQTQLSSGTLTGKVIADVGRSQYSMDGARLEGTLPESVGGSPPAQLEASWSTAQAALDAQTLEITNIDLGALDIRAKMPKLSGSRLLDAPQLRGSLQVEPVAIARVLTTLGLALPGVDASALGTAALRAELSVDPGAEAVKLSGLKLDALGAHLEGEVSTAGDRISGNLRAPSFATATLFKALGNTLPQDPNFRAIDRLAVTTGFDLDTKASTLSLKGLQAELLDSTLAADIVARLGKTEHYSGTLRVDKVAPKPFMSVFGRSLPQGLTAQELGPISIDTGFDYAPGAQLLKLTRLSTTLIGLDFTGNLDVSRFPEAPEYTGQLSVQRFSPRALLKRFGAVVPETADKKVLAAAEGSARIVSNADTGRFEQLQIILDDTRVTGSFAVKDFANPAYDFDLALDAVNVDRYLPPATAPAKAGADTAATGDVVIPVEALKALRIAGKLRAQKMTLGGLQLNQFAATLAARDSLAKLEPVTAAIYNGQFSGGFTADARGAVPTMSVKGKVTDLGVGLFLRALYTEKPAITGTGTFSLDLSGKGETYKKNLGTADGSVAFQLHDGSLRGFDLGHSLCTAYNSIQRQPPPKAKAREMTPFDQIQGTATVKQGVATTQDLSGTTKFLKVTGGGKLYLVEEKLDYDLLATLTAGVGIQGCDALKSLIGQSLPLVIKGTLAEPKVLPDFGELAKQQLKRKAEDELKKKLQDVLQDKLKPKDKKP